MFIKIEAPVLRLPDVMRLTTLSRASIYRLMSENKFPKQIELGHRAVAWRTDDINAWFESKLGSQGE